MVANLNNLMGFMAKTLPALKFMGLDFFNLLEKCEHATQHVIVHKLRISSSFSSFILQQLQILRTFCLTQDKISFSVINTHIFMK